MRHPENNEVMDIFNETDMTPPTDMFASDSDDLLQQLSTELGIPEFMDDSDPILNPSLVDSIGDIYGKDNLEQSLFSEIMHNDAMLTPDTLSLKSEPLSPTFQPSSPSSSDHSNGPLSPPQSPPEQKLIFDGTRFVISGSPPPPQQPAIVTVPDLANLKIPIPKVSRPGQISKPREPVVMTQAQLAQLTQSGAVLKVTPTPKPTSQVKPIIIKSEPVVTTIASPLTTALPTIHTVGPKITSNGVHDMDVKALKRQQRMIKNRESACLSRKKKKEYVTNLEDQITQLSKDNQRLKRENDELRTRVRELESEKSIWADSLFTNPNVKKGTALFALLFMISINFSSLSGLYQEGQQRNPLSPAMPVSNNNPKVHIGGGRSLLWAPEEDVDPVLNVSVSSMCPMNINQSESIRLDNQLRGWFQIDPIAKNRSEPVKTSPLRRRPKKKDTSLGVYKSSLHSLPGSIYHMFITDPVKPQHKLGGNELTLYDHSTPRFTYESFFEAIQRRDDTFYVVSFSGDHLLLPASFHNQSSRPRMSLLLPSVVPLNDSMKLPPNHVAMMQIDCEVMNTRLLHIKEDAIPMQMMKPRTNNQSIQRNESTEFDDLNGPSDPSQVEETPEFIAPPIPRAAFHPRSNEEVVIPVPPVKKSVRQKIVPKKHKKLYTQINP